MSKIYELEVTEWACATSPLYIEADSDTEAVETARSLIDIYNLQDLCDKEIIESSPAETEYIDTHNICCIKEVDTVPKNFKTVTKEDLF